MRHHCKEQDGVSPDPDVADKNNLLNLSYDDLLKNCRQTKEGLSLHRLKLWHATSNLAACRVRSKSLRDRVREAANRGQIRQITDDLNKAYANGSLEGREVMLNFISDVARNASRKDPGKRWHASTARVYQVLKIWGGPRCHLFMKANFDAPSSTTISTAQSKSFVSFLGLRDEHFKELAVCYSGAMRVKAIPYPVLTVAAEDETKIVEGGQWRQRDDSLYGS